MSREDVIFIGEKKTTPQEKYDKENTRFIGLKLNKKTDKDILDALEGLPMQTEIKRLIRIGIAESKKKQKSAGEISADFYCVLSAYFYIFFSDSY